MPIILVGTKLDLRDDKEHAESVNGGCISMEEGLKLQRKNKNIVKYMECSSLNNFGVQELFLEAATVAVCHIMREIRSRRKCTLL